MRAAHQYARERRGARTTRRGLILLRMRFRKAKEVPEALPSLYGLTRGPGEVKTYAPVSPAERRGNRKNPFRGVGDRCPSLSTSAGSADTASRRSSTEERSRSARTATA